MRIVHSAAISLLLTALPLLGATPAAVKSEPPGYFRIALGDYEVTALNDGYLFLPDSLFHHITPAKIQQFTATAFAPRNQEGFLTSVNGYLVNTGKHLVLIDTGAGTGLGPTGGKLISNLIAAGYRPEDVDTIYITHLHGDHIGGLLTADGKRAFPNAELRVAKEDADFWLDEKIAAQAPAAMQEFFSDARAAVKPYRESGRFRPIVKGDTLVEGITANPAHGHTPGHTTYLVGSGGHLLLVCGDIVHQHALQFPAPETTIAFDADQKLAVDDRMRLFGNVADQKWWMAGAHLPFPGIGHIRRDAKAFAWVPIEYQMFGAVNQ